MAGWYIMPIHRVAHLAANHTGGTASTGFAPGNISTLDPNVIASFSTSPVTVKWDRGAADVGIINCCAVINHNLASGGTLAIDSSTDDITYASELSTAPSTTGLDSLFTFAGEATERYMRAVLTFTPAPKVGVLSLGYYYDIGKPILPHRWEGTGPIGGGQPTQAGWDLFTQPRHGARTVNFTFRQVALATAQAVLKAWSRKMTWDTSSDIQDGVGGSSGGTPIVLKDTSNGIVFYGYAQITYNQWTQTLAELVVSMTEIPRPPGAN